MSALLQNSYLLSNLSCNVDNGNGGSLVEAVVWRWRWQRRVSSEGGDSLVVTWQRTQPALGQRRQHISGGGDISAARQQHDSTMVATQEQEIIR
jgi:hypothetical protein